MRDAAGGRQPAAAKPRCIRVPNIVGFLDLVFVRLVVLLHRKKTAPGNSTWMIAVHWRAMTCTASTRL